VKARFFLSGGGERDKSATSGVRVVGGNRQRNTCQGRTTRDGAVGRKKPPLREGAQKKKPNLPNRRKTTRALSLSLQEEGGGEMVLENEENVFSPEGPTYRLEGSKKKLEILDSLGRSSLPGKAERSRERLYTT